MNKDEKAEAYWAGFYDAAHGNKNKQEIKKFLESRRLFFDLNQFHPGDVKVIKDSIDYKRGQFEYDGEINLIQGDVPMVVFEKKNMIGAEALIFMDNLYGSLKMEEDVYEESTFLLYRRFMVNNPIYLNSEKQISVKKTSPGARLPRKNTCLEAGYILYGKKINALEHYDTFLIIEPPYGYYFEIHPHPKLKELGYTFANEVPIIYDRKMTRRQSLKIHLKKKGKKCEELCEETPIALLIPRMATHLQIKEIVG